MCSDSLHWFSFGNWSWIFCCGRWERVFVVHKCVRYSHMCKCVIYMGGLFSGDTISHPSHTCTGEEQNERKLDIIPLSPAETILPPRHCPGLPCSLPQSNFTC